MSVSRNRSELLKRSSVVATLLDAAMEFRKGRRGSGLLLLGAAVLSSRVPGAGTAVSILLRAFRRLR
jgi:hypothetical protein